MTTVPVKFFTLEVLGLDRSESQTGLMGSTYKSHWKAGNGESVDGEVPRITERETDRSLKEPHSYTIIVRRAKACCRSYLCGTLKWLENDQHDGQ